MALRRIIAVVVVSAIFGACTPSSESDAAKPRRIRLVSSVALPRATDIFRRINDERRARHLAPLKWDQRLADYAVHWSKVMASKHKMYHSNIGSLLGRYNYVGENVAMGTRGVPVSNLHVGWMKSQGHRDNNLANAFQNVGVGISCASDHSIWATVEFGRPASSGKAPPTNLPTPRNPIVRTDGNRLGCK